MSLYVFLNYYLLQATEPEISTAVIKNIGISIECYGRLLMHNEAMNLEVPINFPSEARTLMMWVTSLVVPSLEKLLGQDSTLRDLDLSLISGTESPACSPIADAPPRRKVNRVSSPSSAMLSDSIFTSEEQSFHVYQERSKFAATRATAVTVISSVLITFSEWLSVRGIGDSTVSDQVLKWCRVLKSSDHTVRKALLPTFCRISYICLKNDGDATFFIEVVLSMNDGELNENDEEIISIFMASISSSREDHVLKAVIATTVHATCSIIQKLETDEKGSNASLLLLDKVGVCMSKVLMAIFKESRSSLQLAQYLLDVPEGGVESTVRADLFNELNHHSPKTDALAKILSRWNNCSSVS